MKRFTQKVMGALGVSAAIASMLVVGAASAAYDRSDAVVTLHVPLPACPVCHGG